VAGTDADLGIEFSVLQKRLRHLRIRLRRDLAVQCDIHFEPMPPHGSAEFSRRLGWCLMSAQRRVFPISRPEYPSGFHDLTQELRAPISRLLQSPYTSTTSL
jgi:hypothetical protein